MQTSAATQAKHCLVHICEQWHANTPAFSQHTLETFNNMPAHKHSYTSMQPYEYCLHTCMLTCLQACALIQSCTHTHAPMHTLSAHLPQRPARKALLLASSPSEDRAPGLHWKYLWEKWASTRSRSWVSPIKASSFRNTLGRRKEGACHLTQVSLTRQPWFLAMPSQLGKGYVRVA